MSEHFFSLCLCTWTKDKGLTFLMWLSEGQYYRRQERYRPILKLWGLIFLKSLVIVFDKSIWEAFREQIRDATWPTFPSPPLPSPTLPPPVLDQSFNQAYLKVGHSNLQTTLPRTLPSWPPPRSLFLACVVFLSVSSIYLPFLPLSLCIPNIVKWRQAERPRQRPLMFRLGCGCCVKCVVREGEAS